MWNGLFTLLFKSFSERVIDSDCASKFSGISSYKAPTLPHDTMKSLVLILGIFLFKGKSANSTFQCSKIPLLQGFRLSTPRTSYLLITPNLALLAPFLKLCCERRFLLRLINPKGGGCKKRIVKFGPSEPPQAPKRKKVKKMARKPRSPTPSDREGSQSNTVSKVPVHVSTPITIAPCPPVSLGISQSHTSFFTNSSVTTTTTTDELLVNVNPSDVEARYSGFIFGHSTARVSPLREDDPETIFGALMSTFKSSFDSNNAKANEAISNLSVSLCTEKKAHEKVRTGI
ncbi:unnamed protein product [Lactuca saligna]|uniref:Uncharacterized protein n=1 Tax=Lactuca saligna TaxID=75948 RepID=A0AA35Z032_LACSI|nr:unnamed protein product [Lactuca saligna]